MAVGETGIRSLLKPEWILLLCAVLVTFGLMWRASSGECPHWKERLGHVTGGFLATAGEEEYPQAGLRTDLEARANLRRATEKVLDSRPVGCF